MSTSNTHPTLIATLLQYRAMTNFFEEKISPFLGLVCNGVIFEAHRKKEISEGGS